MRKYRGWLIGLGIGLMLGASMLQLMTAAQRAADDPSLPGEQPSVDELQKEADAIGYKLLRSTDPTYTQEQLDAAVAEARKEAGVKAGTGAAAGAGDTGAEATTPAVPEKDAASEPSAPAGTPEEEATVSLYVRASASLTEVATALKELGLIDDKDAFVKQAKPYSGKLRVGVSTFRGKPSVSDIIAELTRAKY